MCLQALAYYGDKGSFELPDFDLDGNVAGQIGSNLFGIIGLTLFLIGFWSPTSPTQKDE